MYLTQNLIPIYLNYITATRLSVVGRVKYPPSNVMDKTKVTLNNKQLE